VVVEDLPGLGDSPAMMLPVVGDPEVLRSAIGTPQFHDVAKEVLPVLPVVEVEGGSDGQR
jgi:hypothetical protein